MKCRLGLVFATCLSTAALAVECPQADGVGGTGVGTKSGEERLAFLAQTFDQESQSMNRWMLAFGGGFAALTVGQAGLMGAFPKDQQPDWYWGAISSAVGVATVLLSNPEASREAPVFRQRAAAAQSPEQVCSLVAEGEKLLESGSGAEAFGTAWYAHVANVLFNVGFGLLYYFGYDHLQTAIVNTAVGTVLGEAMILFQPTGLVTGWERYKTGAIRKPLIAWSVFPAGLGAGVMLRF